MNEAVFLDVTSLSPGDLWEQQIMNGSRCVRLYHLLVLRWQGLRIHRQRNSHRGARPPKAACPRSFLRRNAPRGNLRELTKMAMDRLALANRASMCFCSRQQTRGVRIAVRRDRRNLATTVARVLALVGALIDVLIAFLWVTSVTSDLTQHSDTVLGNWRTVCGVHCSRYEWFPSSWFEDMLIHAPQSQVIISLNYPVAVAHRSGAFRRAFSSNDGKSGLREFRTQNDLE
jgi:hypothetical protein